MTMMFESIEILSQVMDIIDQSLNFDLFNARRSHKYVFESLTK